MYELTTDAKTALEGAWLKAAPLKRPKKKSCPTTEGGGEDTYLNSCIMSLQQKTLMTT